jgi:hypothetical protein
MYHVQHFTFFRRERVDTSDYGTVSWEVATYPTLSPMLMRPVAAGFWMLKETFDGTYTVDDLLDILEVMDLKSENEFRAEDFRRRSNDVR